MCRSILWTLILIGAWGYCMTAISGVYVWDSNVSHQHRRAWGKSSFLWLESVWQVELLSLLYKGEITALELKAQQIISHFCWNHFKFYSGTMSCCLTWKPLSTMLSAASGVTRLEMRIISFYNRLIQHYFGTDLVQSFESCQAAIVLMLHGHFCSWIYKNGHEGWNVACG